MTSYPGGNTTLFRWMPSGRLAREKGREQVGTQGVRDKGTPAVALQRRGLRVVIGVPEERRKHGGDPV